MVDLGNGPSVEKKKKKNYSTLRGFHEASMLRRGGSALDYGGPLPANLNESRHSRSPMASQSRRVRPYGVLVLPVP